MPAQLAKSPDANVPSRYKRPPEKKFPTSHRLPGSVIRKVEMIREIWKARAEADGEAADVIDDINDTHVVSTLLAEATDAELGELGGVPRDDKALQEILERIKKKKSK